MEKSCITCGVVKPFGEFYSSKSRSDGRTGSCKTCMRSYRINWYHNTPGVKEKHSLKAKNLRKTNAVFVQSAALRSKKFYESPDGRAKTLFNNAKKSPTSKKFPFTLTLEHLENGIRFGFCAVTGVKFDLTDNYQKRHGAVKNPYAPSVDRIDPRKGYSNENTRVVIWQYNLMKGEMTDSELVELCKLILGKINDA